MQLIYWLLTTFAHGWVTIEVSEGLLARLKHEAVGEFKIVEDKAKVEEVKLQIDSKQFNGFSDILFRLKDTRRGAWTGMKLYEDVESIADHMYRLAMLVWVSNPKGVDRDRCIRMALVHDLAEAIVGDITPEDGVSKEEKSSRESKAMQEITDELPREIGTEMMDLWREYEAGETVDAKLVKELDKFEFALTSYDYERSEKHRKMKNFNWSKVDYFWKQTEEKVKLFYTSIYQEMSKARGLKSSGL